MYKINDIQLRAQVVILAKEGYSQSVIAKKLKRSKRWVTKWVGRSKDSDRLVDKERSGRPKILSNAAKRRINATKYKRGQSLRCIANQLKARNQRGSKGTIRSYMVNDLKWKNWRRKKLPLLTDAHKKRRIRFAREHQHWTAEDWSNVMFTDESPFKVFYVPNSKNDTVWGSQEDNVPPAAQMKFSPSVMVWGGMTARGLSSLHFIPSGTRLNSDYYIRNILEKLVKPTFERSSDDDNVTQRKLFANNDLGVFQQDGARCHTSAVTTKWLNDNIPSYIKPQDWPPNSPDLSPIENLWSILSLSVYKDPEPKNIAQLKRRLQQAWKSVKVETLQKMIQSMPDRVRAVMKEKGNTVR
jgi:Winged helix-turn helix